MIEVVIPSVRETAIVQRLLDSIARADPRPDLVTVVRDSTEPLDWARVLHISSDYYPIGYRDAALRRNVGIWAAEADTIVFLDDDLIVPPSIFGDVDRLMSNLEYIWGHHRYIDFTGHSPDEIAELPPEMGRSRERTVPDFHGWQSCYAGMFAARRSLLIKMGGFDMQFSMRHAGEDQHLGYRLMRRAGERQVYIHEPPFAWHPEGFWEWPEQTTNLCSDHDFYTVDGVVRCHRCPYLYVEETRMGVGLRMPFEPDRVHIL